MLADARDYSLYSYKNLCFKLNQYSIICKLIQIMIVLHVMVLIFFSIHQASSQYIVDLYPYSSCYKWEDEDGKTYSSLGWCQDSSYLQISDHAAIKTYSWEGSQVIQLNFSTFFIDIDQSKTTSPSLDIYVDDILLKTVTVPKISESRNLCGGKEYDVNVSYSITFDLRDFPSGSSDSITLKFSSKNSGKAIVGISNIQLIGPNQQALPAWATALIALVSVLISFGIIFYFIRNVVNKRRKTFDIKYIVKKHPITMPSLKGNIQTTFVSHTNSNITSSSSLGTLDKLFSRTLTIEVKSNPEIESAKFWVGLYSPHDEADKFKLEAPSPKTESPLPNL